MKDIQVTRIATRFGLSGRTAGRAATTMADQCVASVSNFAVGVVVARLTGPVGLGAFAFAYTCWILMNRIHRAVIPEPMMILGDMRQKQKIELLREGFAAEVILGVMATLVFAAIGAILLAVGQHTFGMGLLVITPWIAFLDLQDYWRQVGFMQAQPKKSLQNDLMFALVQALAFAGAFLTGLHSVFAAVSAWGLGAMVSTLYGLHQFSVPPSLRGGWTFLRTRLPTSKWLAGERTASWGANESYLLLAGALLGPAALGGLKAARALVVGPAMVVINAGGSFGLPEACRQLAERGWAGLARTSRFVAATAVLATVASGLIIFVAAGPLLGWLYGPQFAAFATSARIFAITFVILAFGIGPTLVLNATIRVRPLAAIQLAKWALVIAAVCLLSKLYGVNGAAMASLLAALFNLVALFILQSSARRAVQGAEMESSPAAMPPAGIWTMSQGELFSTSQTSATSHTTSNESSAPGGDAAWDCRPLRSFTPEFSGESLQSCRCGNTSVGPADHRFDHVETAVREPATQAHVDADEQPELTTATDHTLAQLRRQNRRLLRENRKLREDNDVLKRAAAFLTQETQ